MTSFADKATQTESNILLLFAPKFEKLPLPITRYDDPFLPFGKAIITATQDLVAGYIFDLASYLAMAGAGAVALERTIAFVPRQRVTILHAPFTGTDFAPMADSNAFAVDALTVTTPQDARYYTAHPPYTAFLVTDQSSECNTYQPSIGQVYHHITDKAFTVPPADLLYGSKMDDFAIKVREGIQQLT